MKVELYTTEPSDFSSKISVSAAYIRYEGRYLFLRTSALKQHVGKWGVPGGKIERGETTQEAVIREIEEETGIVFNPDKIYSIDSIYIRKNFDFIFHMFGYEYQALPEIQLSEEHDAHIWVTPKEARDLPLISGGHLILDHLCAKLNTPFS